MSVSAMPCIAINLDAIKMEKMAGVRVMVGGSGGRYSPSEVKLGGRAHPLPSPSGKRWHVLRMTPGEALAAAPDTPMQASTHA